MSVGAKGGISLECRGDEEVFILFNMKENEWDDNSTTNESRRPMQNCFMINAQCDKFKGVF